MDAPIIARQSDQTRKANAQIAVVTVRTTEGVPIEEFSIDLATGWGIGPKKSDRGVLVLLAVNDHHYRVEVGYGLEPILPDGKVGGFGREIIPLLRADDYSGALLLITRRIGDVIARDRGVTLTGQTPSTQRHTKRPDPGSVAAQQFLLLLLSGDPSSWGLFFSLFLVLLGMLWWRMSRHGKSVGDAIGDLLGGGGFGAGGASGGDWGGGGFGGSDGGGFGGGGASGSW